jgi:hypothetical protein
MIEGHLRSLRCSKRYGNAYLLIFIEANMSFIQADAVAGWCQPFGPLYIERQQPGDNERVGVWTGPYEKESYAFLLREVIEEDTIFFASEMIGRDPQKQKDLLLTQLRKFHMEKRPPNDPAFGKFKYAFTGKTGGGSKDDLVLALMIAMYWGRRRREHKEFKRLCEEQGYRL